MSDDIGPVDVVAEAVEAVVSGVADVVHRVVDAQNTADRLWDGVLKANRGGQHRAGAFTTDFEAVPTVAGLRAMIETTDPAAVQVVADHWQRLHDELRDSAAQLTTHADNLLEHWTGPSADAFRRQVGTLHTSLTNGAAHAANAAAATGGVAHALTRARTDMPADPSLLDTVLRLFTSQGVDWQFKSDAAKHGIARALAADGAQLSAPEQARQQAVVVMERLGVAYNNASVRLNHLPTPPAMAAHARGVWPPHPGAAATAHANLLGYGGLRTVEGGVGGGGTGGTGGGGPVATSAPAPGNWIGAPVPDASPTARAYAAEQRRTGAAGESEPGSGTTRQPGEGLRPSGGRGSSGSRRRRTRYPLSADAIEGHEQTHTNPPVIES